MTERKTQSSTHPIYTPTDLEVPGIGKKKTAFTWEGLGEAVSSGEG